MTVSSEIDDIFRWIDDPPASRTLNVASLSSVWEHHDYQEVARLTNAATRGMVAAGIRRNDVVIIAMQPGLQFVSALFGSMRAGATVAVIASARVFDNAADYGRHLRHVVDVAAPRTIVTSADMAPIVEAAELNVPVRVVDELLATGSSQGPVARRSLADLALLQFTSGSSGPTRAVAVPYNALAANITAIRQWLDWTHDDAAAFWVPPYHDMGLVGGLLAPLASQCHLWLLTSEQFVRSPLTYLKCFGVHGARLSALPSFGLEYIVRRVKSPEIAGMDFSQVKAFVIGAEPIHHAVLEQFCNLLEPFGLQRRALLPAYGLAEATLAVSGLPRGSLWTVRSPSTGGAGVVGCGSPLPGVTITIVDECGTPVRNGDVGEIVVEGRSLASGYLQSHASDSLSAFVGGTLRSGDAGFIVDQQLYPVGRLGDSIKLRGRPLFAEWLENELLNLGYSRDRNVVLLGNRNGRPIVIWIAEDLRHSEPTDGLTLLARLSEGAKTILIRAAKGTIARTTSGKPRRRAMWMDVVNDRIRGTVSTYSGTDTGD
jgi:acyl-CoA synthetase (AMP-forming)/AMP-acid ligase II